jgi:hypothetical protein
MSDDQFAERDELYKALGRIVVALSEAQRPVTNDSLRLMLHSYMSLNDDAYLAKIYDAANKVME